MYAPLQFIIHYSELQGLHVEIYSLITWSFLAKSGMKSTEQRIQMMW